MTRRRYQVFISSTFADLHTERQAVTWEVLKLRHIPAGMENFPATNDRGWRIIQRTIDDSDYYVLLIAGRYGTVDQGGISWTEREYEYARSKGIPVLAFVREKGSITFDTVDGENAEKLAAFIAKVGASHHRSAWTTKEDLTTKVVQALNNEILDDEESAETQRPGWIRGNSSAEEALAELTRLSKENAELRAQLAEVTTVEKAAALDLRFDGQGVDGLAMLPDLSVDVPDYHLVGGGQNTVISAMMAFARRAARTIWLNARLHNNGTAIARNVKVKLLARTRVEGIQIGEYERTYQTRPAYPPSRYIAGSEAVHVLADSLMIGSCGSVEQRVRSIGIRHDERLIRVGFVLPEDELKEAGVMKFALEYSATSEAGEHVAGMLGVTVRRGARRDVTPQSVDSLL